MKKLISTVAVLMLAACSGQQNASTTMSSTDSIQQYLMAEHVEYEAHEALADGQTYLTLAYDLPCWASPVQLVSVTDIQGSPINPAADFAVAVGVLLKGNLALPCDGITRKTISGTVNTNAVEGHFLGFKMIDAKPTSASNPLYFAAKNVVISSQHETSGQTSLSLEYDLPCWASPVFAFDAADVIGSHVNPAADFAVAVGLLVKGNPMLPCVGSSRKTISTVVNTNAVEGHFLGLKLVQK